MKYFIRKICILSIGIIFLAGLFSPSPASQRGGKEIAKSNIDKSVNPRVDFYDYAVGNWIKKTKIPSSYPAWNTFYELNDNNYHKLKFILLKAEKDKDAKEGSISQKVGDFFYTGMDTTKIEEEGMKPIEAELKAIDRIRTKKDFYSQLALIHLSYNRPLFSFFSAPDAKNSKMEIAQLNQSGLGLPDRDYYLKDDNNTKEIREKYLRHVENMFVLIGENSKIADQDANTILEIETRLAKASMSRVKMRDPKNTYHKISVKKLIENYPEFQWDEYFALIGIQNPGSLNVRQPKYFKEVDKMVKSIPLKKWKSYLKWNVIRAAAPYISSKFEKEHFNFYGTILYGIKTMQPRWKRVLGTINSHVGELLGQLYVKRYFPPKAKARAKKIVLNLMDVFASRIKNLNWMSPVTKKQALKKYISIKKILI